MKWVAVDLGASTIKASVLDKGDNPVRLSYPMGDYATTLLSSVVVVTEDKKVILGDYASQLGVSNPSMRVYNWLDSQYNSLIAKAIFVPSKSTFFPFLLITTNSFFSSPILLLPLFYFVL